MSDPTHPRPTKSAVSHHHLTIAPSRVATSMERASVGDAPEAELEGELLQVGELAKATGKTVRAIHLYEDLGLLRPQARSEGRYRLFARESLVRVRWISKLQSLGLSLSEIQDIVREHEASESAMFASARLREVYLAKLVETRSKIDQLRQLEVELEASLHFLSSCDTTCVPAVTVDSCPTCARHTETSHAPDLVAGARAQGNSARAH